MAINWNQIKADFGDANSAMRNSQASLSQAGTVFSDLRKAVLDEEQRAVENAFKLANFNLDKDKLAQDAEQFRLTNQLNIDKLAEEKRANEALEKYRNAQLANTVWQRNNNKLYAEAERDFFNKSHELDTTVLSTKKAFDDFKKANPNDSTSEAYKTLEAAFNKAQAERASLPTTANEAKLYIMRDARNRGYIGTGAINSALDDYGQYELDKATKAATTAVTKAKDRKTAITKKSEAIGKEAWDSAADAGNAQAAFTSAAMAYPDLDVNLIEGLLKKHVRNELYVPFMDDNVEFSSEAANAFMKELETLHKQSKQTGVTMNDLVTKAVVNGSSNNNNKGLLNLPISIKDGGAIPESPISWKDIPASGFVDPEAYGKSLNKPASFFGFTAR